MENMREKVRDGKWGEVTEGERREGKQAGDGKRERERAGERGREFTLNVSKLTKHTNPNPASMQLLRL